MTLTSALFPAPDIESLLRGSAPALPLALKKRTLHHCAVRALERQQRSDRLHWRLTWAVAAVLALQGVTLFLVDGQNARLLTGDSTPPPFTPISIAEVTALWHQRSRQLALLQSPTKIG